MRYKGLELCGENLGRHTGPVTECIGYNRICYGKPGHGGPHGDLEWPGQAVLLLSDEELDRLSTGA